MKREECERLSCSTPLAAAKTACCTCEDTFEGLENIAQVPALNTMISLADLPAELIQDIVELVHASRPKQYLGSVSRLFLPFSRQLVFRKVEVETYEALDKLCKVVGDGGEVGSTIEEPELNLEYRFDKQHPENQVIRRLFRTLSALTTLTIKHSTRLTELLLTPRNSSFLPSLADLTLKGPFTEWPNPFDPTHFLALDTYDELNSLTLQVVDRSLWSIKSHKSQNLELSSDRSWWLSLEGPIHWASVGDLIGSFPLIDSLNLNPPDFGFPRPLLPLFEAVQNPSTVSIISLGSTPFSTADVVSILTLFPHLKTVELAPPASCDVVFAAFRSLPKLRYIYLLNGQFVPSHLLKALVTDPTKPPRLRLLAVRTVRYCDAGCCASPWDEEGGTFELDGMIEVLEAADVSGIEVTGLAAEVARQEQETRRKKREEEEEAKAKGKEKRRTE